MKILYCLGLAAMVACGGGGGAPTPDAGTPDAGPTQVGVVDFVTDLVAHHTDETGAPARVVDTPIVDTQDPAAFNSLLGF